jgi:hypothetical protein
MLTVISGIFVSPFVFATRQTVIAGLDPAIHHLEDGYAGQARV